MLETSKNVQAAEVSLPCHDLQADLSFYTEKLGFRLDQIFPADNPAVAVISGYGIRLRLERSALGDAGTLRLLCHDPQAFAAGELALKTPSGTKVELAVAHPSLALPKPQYSLLVQKLQKDTAWGIGRAGMHYRDLLPDRLGGAMIASHIRIPEGGPVADMVHYHTIGFQLIFCYKGWVKVVYEDQGSPFYLKAGDCVIQPPEIRHRVLESSENLEVIEIGVPAEHMTTMDHDLALPTPSIKPERRFGGQKFCRHEAVKAIWQPWRLAGFQCRETGICEATGGVASVQVVRTVGGKTTPVTSHTSEILFIFVMAGKMSLRAEGHNSYGLSAGDAFAIPPHFKMSLSECSEDLELLEVSLPGNFETIVHPDKALV